MIVWERGSTNFTAEERKVQKKRLKRSFGAAKYIGKRPPAMMVIQEGASRECISHNGAVFFVTILKHSYRVRLKGITVI